MKPLPRLRALPALLLAAACACAPVAVAETTSKKTTSSKPSASKTTATTTKTAAKKTTATKKPASVSSARQDLDRVQRQIRASEQRIQLTKEQRAQKEAELRQAETEISELRESVHDVQSDVRAREQKLLALRVERSARQDDRERLLGHIRNDLRLAQRQGGEDHYKLLLNQQDPQAVARLMKYYGYLQQARSGRVEQLNVTLARLDEIEREEQDELARLKSLRNDLEGKQTKLAAAQKTRADVIRVLDARIESEEEKVARLRRDQQSLQELMDRLEKAAREAAERAAREREQARLAEEKRAREAQAAGKPAPAPAPRPTPLPPAQPDFRVTPYSGRCPLPADGGIRARFGTARAGGLRWNGIVIAASEGSPVRAIRPGKVAYADYLRGYGQLIIIDHGRGLMSLYGQNASLARKVGDNVGGNEVIATVGSGDSEVAGLYFEIRHRGRPSDPAAWCSFQ